MLYPEHPSLWSTAARVAQLPYLRRRVLTVSASLPSLRDRLRRPPAHWCVSLTGDRYARPAQYRAPFIPFAFRFADGGRFAPPVICFCSDRPHRLGGAGPAKDWLSGVAASGESVFSPPCPPVGESLSPFPFPLSSERGQRRVA